jgi:hypothetical protein
MNTTIHNGQLPINVPDWDALEDIFRQLRIAYLTPSDVRFRALLYMLQLGLEDLKDAARDRPSEGCFVHPAESKEIQAGAVRADRGEDRSSDPA